jgi:hypothetical protein
MLSGVVTSRSRSTDSDLSTAEDNLQEPSNTYTEMPTGPVVGLDHGAGQLDSRPVSYARARVEFGSSGYIVLGRSMPTFS